MICWYACGCELPDKHVVGLLSPRAPPQASSNRLWRWDRRPQAMPPHHGRCRRVRPRGLQVGDHVARPRAWAIVWLTTPIDNSRLKSRDGSSTLLRRSLPSALCHLPSDLRPLPGGFLSLFGSERRRTGTVRVLAVETTALHAERNGNDPGQGSQIPDPIHQQHIRHPDRFYFARTAGRRLRSWTAVGLYKRGAARRRAYSQSRRPRYIGDS